MVPEVVGPPTAEKGRRLPRALPRRRMFRGTFKFNLKFMDTNLNEPSPVPSRPPSMGLAIASLVLGIVGIGLSLFLVGGLLGLIGIVLGIAHLRKKNRPAAMAGWGVGFGSLAVAMTIGLGMFYYRIYQEFSEMMAGMEGGSELTQWEGVAAPDLLVTTLDGEKLRLDDLRGRRVVLNFWATWCGPCVKEIPHFIKLADETDNAELVIIGISREDGAVQKAFAEKKWDQLHSGEN